MISDSIRCGITLHLCSIRFLIFCPTGCPTFPKLVDFIFKKQREPDDRLGYTMFVFELTDEEITNVTIPTISGELK